MINYDDFIQNNQDPAYINYALKLKGLKFNENSNISVLTDSEFDFWFWLTEYQRVPVAKIIRVDTQGNVLKSIELINGLKVACKDKNVIMEYQYDEDGRKKFYRCNDFSITYFYENGLLVKEVNSYGEQILYEYDRFNRLSKVYDNGKIITYNYVIYYRGYFRIIIDYGDFWEKIYKNEERKTYYENSLGYKEWYNYDYYKIDNRRKKAFLVEYSNSDGLKIVYDYSFKNELVKIFTNLQFNKLPFTVTII